MIQIERILCPTDFSETSDRALDHAVALAHWYGASVTVLHVPAAALPAIPPGGELPYPLGLAPELRQQLLDRLDELVQGARTAGLTMQVALHEGEPAREVLRQADEIGAGLVVMGTHGRGGFERLVLGSMTEKVLKKASCPVLTIPPGARAETPAVQAGYKTILCATDFSETSANAVRYALSLAQEADATLTLLHVVETYLDDLTDPDATYRETRDREARERLRAAIPDEARTWCTLDERVAVGRAYQEVLRVAQELDVGVIVMGAHGQHALDRLFFGSTTHRVIHGAQRPVLTLRAGA